MMGGELLTYHVIHFLRKLFFENRNTEFENRNTKFYGAISASQEKNCAKQGKEKHHILRSQTDFWQQNSQIAMFTLGDQIFSS